MPVVETFDLRNCDFLVSESRGDRTYERGTLSPGQNLPAGAVLGRITTGGAYTALAPAATDGSQNAAAILYAATDATAGAQSVTLVVRDAEVNGKMLTWPAGITAGARTAAIAALATEHLMVRP